MICRVEAEFVIQNGEGGPRTLGLRVLLNAHDFSKVPGYFDKVIVPQMTNRFMEDIHQDIEDGKLWEGAYLVTHPHDSEEAP